MRLPALDAHAHVEVGIDPGELIDLGAVLFAVTRETGEWAAAVERNDELCIWGLGCHPGLAPAADAFEQARLESLLARTPLLGEIGLDGRSPVPAPRQAEIFDAVLALAQRTPRLVSIHSRGRSAQVLDRLEARPITGAILHWWRGDAGQTARAIELGCFFSVNGAEARRPTVLAQLPSERVLTETDFPHSRRQDPAADRPGAVGTIEEALSREWGVERSQVRRRVWANLENLCRATATTELFPRRVREALLASATAAGATRPELP